MTQMSVQSPIKVTLSSSFCACKYSASATEPKLGLSKICMASVLSDASFLSICHPSVSLIQCKTGRFLPSCVSIYLSVCVSRVKITSPSKVLTTSATLSTIASASFVPSAPLIKSFCISTTIRAFFIIIPFHFIYFIAWVFFDFFF